MTTSRSEDGTDFGRHAARLALSGPTLVVGLGATGLSCARFLHRLGLPFAVTDSRTQPPQLAALQAELPDVPLFLGGLSEQALEACGNVVLSPGVSQQEPLLLRARERGLPVLGDIELFARCADAPVLAVTGSNGKSTVTALLGEMARAAGLDVRVGGNIGTPALELLQARAPDLYVLELSSFQLETTGSLNARAATILNLSPDHLDRYASIEEYRDAKLRICQGDGVLVLNRDDAELMRSAPAGRVIITFGAQAPVAGHYGLREHGGRRWLACGERRLAALDELRLRGMHNALNALAALALGAAGGLPDEAMIAALRSFPGLPHRMQYAGHRRGALWYNDSKGTNVGATLAALGGMDAPVVLIAGGLGKGQDFAPLRAAVARQARAVVLIGRDAPLIEAALQGTVPIEHAADMNAAVRRAAALVQAGDCVLLSPACASFDMFTGFEDRGRRFMAAVEALEP